MTSSTYWFFGPICLALICLCFTECCHHSERRYYSLFYKALKNEFELHFLCFIHLRLGILPVLRFSMQCFEQSWVHVCLDTQLVEMTPSSAGETNANSEILWADIKPLVAWNGPWGHNWSRNWWMLQNRSLFCGCYFYCCLSIFKRQLTSPSLVLTLLFTSSTSFFI